MIRSRVPRQGVLRPHSVLFFAVSFLVIAGFFGCTPKTPDEEGKKGSDPPPLAPLRYVVKDTFNTGPGNIVRAVKAHGDFLWVGTTGGILKTNRLTGEMVQTYTKEDGLTSNYIFTINVDPGGNPWFGTDAGGLMHFAEDQWTIFGTEDGLSDPWVYDIEFHPDGTMWVATWNGVSRYDPKAPKGSRFTTVDTTDGLVNKWVYGLAVDADQSLWFGTEEGANRFDPKAPPGQQWAIFNHDDGLGASNDLALARKKTTGEKYEEFVRESGVELAPGRSYSGHYHDIGILDAEGNETYNENYIFALEIDPAGNKWFGTWGGGVSRFDGKQWKNFTTEEGVAGNIIYSLALDPVSGIWAGTNHGLSYFDGSTWTSYGEADGLMKGDVYAVSIDADRDVWIGQRGGVVHLALPGVPGGPHG